MRRLLDVILFPIDYMAVQKTNLLAHGRKANLFRPQSFNDHIQAQKLFSRFQLQTQLADKLAVRDYVRDRVGDSYLTELLWEGDDIRELANHLPDRQFVIKASHGSGMNEFVFDSQRIDWRQLHTKTQHWLNTDYSTIFNEWPYRYIRPRLFAEGLLPFVGDEPPRDYKFYCFGGIAQFVQIDASRFTKHTRLLVTRDFEVLPFSFHYPRPIDACDPPANFNTLLQLAEALAKGLCFARIDLYDVGRPVFGEITFFPEGGTGKFMPDYWDSMIGQLFCVRK